MPLFLQVIDTTFDIDFQIVKYIYIVFMVEWKVSIVPKDICLFVARFWPKIILHSFTWNEQSCDQGLNNAMKDFRASLTLESLQIPLTDRRSVWKNVGCDESQHHQTPVQHLCKYSMTESSQKKPY